MLLESHDAGEPLSSKHETQLAQMAESARVTLHNALQVGKVVIVTNAEQGWVENSCTVFMPSLVSLLQTVDIVSARSTHEKYTKNPAEWKRLAFVYEVALFYGAGCAGQQRNIVSMGDSLHEQSALMSVTKGVPGCCGKSIKFLENPTIEQLIEQHECLNETFLDVVEYNGDLDVEIGTENSYACM